MKETVRANSRRKRDDERESKVAGKPVSLAPLEFEEALRDLLQVPPSKVKEAEQKKRITKKSAK